MIRLGRGSRPAGDKNPAGGRRLHTGGWIGRIARGAAIALPVLLLVPAAGSAQDHEFVGVKKCRSCHKKEAIGNQYGKWLEGKHSKAFETLGSADAKKLASERGISDPQTSDDCLKCHVTAHGAPAELVSKKFDPTLGVQCESCHGAGKDYRKKKIMVDEELAISKGLVIPKEEVCVKCHNDESPSWDPAKYTLADGSKVGFDFELASEEIAHPVPEGYDPEADEDEEEDDD